MGEQWELAKVCPINNFFTFIADRDAYTGTDGKA